MSIFDPAKLKLIVWDLDNTFWDGVLSEEEVAPVGRNMDIVRLAADRGIISSICSKNDPGPVRDELISERFGGIWEYFVFPSVDWTSKGARIRAFLMTWLSARRTLCFSTMRCSI